MTAQWTSKGRLNDRHINPQQQADLYILIETKKIYVAVLSHVFKIHDAFDRGNGQAKPGPLIAQVAWLRGYDLRQSTRLK